MKPTQRIFWARRHGDHYVLFPTKQTAQRKHPFLVALCAREWERYTGLLLQPGAIQRVFIRFSLTPR